MTAQDIINGTLSYFLLGPFIWLARKNPNFSHPFIQGHARRSTWIITIGALGLMLYIFILKPITHISVGPFLLSNIILLIAISLFLSVLLWHAYRAFKGEYAREIRIEKIDQLPSTEKFDTSTLTEQEKFLSTLAFIPYLGNIIFARFPNSRTEYGETVGSWALFIIVLISLLFGVGYSIGLILTFLYIVFVVSVGVFLFLEERWIKFRVLKALPSLDEINLYIRAMGIYSYDALKLISGKDITLGFQDIISRLKNKNEEITTHEFLFPPLLIAIPVINLITLPAFFREKYRMWRRSMMQGYIITILVFLIIYFYGSSSLVLLLLMIPTMFLAANVKTNPHVDSPIIGVFVDLIDKLLFGMLTGKREIAAMHQHKDEVKFTYK